MASIGTASNNDPLRLTLLIEFVSLKGFAVIVCIYLRGVSIHFICRYTSKLYARVVLVSR
jgi:hypothetical protein